jgi:hypothetical protein
LRAERKFRPLPLEAVTLLSEGKVADAIRVVRAAERLGLKQARQRIDEHLAQDPILRVQIETQRSARRRMLFAWFLFSDLVIAAAVIYWLYQRGSL